MGAYRKHVAWTVGIIETFKILRNTIAVTVNVICSKEKNLNIKLSRPMLISFRGLSFLSRHYGMWNGTLDWLIVVV